MSEMLWEVYAVKYADRNNRMRVEFRLWDVFAQQQMVGQVYTTVSSNCNIAASRSAKACK